MDFITNIVIPGIIAVILTAIGNIIAYPIQLRKIKDEVKIEILKNQEVKIRSEILPTIWTNLLTAEKELDQLISQIISPFQTEKNIIDKYDTAKEKQDDFHNYLINHKIYITDTLFNLCSELRKHTDELFTVIIMSFPEDQPSTDEIKEINKKRGELLEKIEIEIKRGLK